MCDQRNHPEAAQTCLLAAGLSDSRHFSPGDYFHIHLQLSSGFLFWGGEGSLLPSRPLSWLQKASSFEQVCTCFHVTNGELDFLTLSDSSERRDVWLSSQHTPSLSRLLTHILLHIFLSWCPPKKKKKPSPITSPQLTQTFPFPEQLSYVGKQNAQ